VKSYANEKKKNVGMAKSGWAACASDLGKSQPGWLSKSGTGGVEKHLSGEKPYIILTNRVSYFSTLDQRGNIVSRALDGRAKDMITSLQYQLKQASKGAGLA
jgi:hypothetical protein